MKKILLLFVLTIFGGFSSTAQLITFDDQGHADLAFLGNPYTIGNGGETFIFTLSNGGAAIAANHRYRTTDLEGCNNTDLSYLRGGNSTATTWTIETSSGNELNLNEVRFLNLYECYNFDYVLTITGFKNTVSTGSQPFTVTNSNSVFIPNASFDDVDKIVITTAVDLGNIGIDDINWGAPITPCTDPTIPTITSTPTTVCEGSSTTLNISGTLNDATQWAIYSGTCGGTLVGTATGASPSIVVTPSAGSTTYFVRGEGGCVTSGSCGSTSITTTALDDASFSYSASAYCVDATDPSATITGLSGGSFSSTSGLSINTSTGAIDVSASTPGLYTVTYTTAGTCPNSSNVNVTVNALDDASFSYSASAYCVDATDPSATITGLSGGSFSSTSGLSINTSTGAIDVSASTPGLYTVTYTTAGTCPNSSNVNVTVNALDDASFSYSASAYCVDATDPSATITGLSGGSFSSTSGLSINTSTGAIDVSASTPGLYTVTYTTAGTCPNSSNVNVTVNALDDASFNYSASAYCVDATDPSATITGLSGGSFSSTSGLSINTSTGAIDVSASTPGLYTVTYTTAGTCPNSSNVNVTVNALDDASFSYSASAYCVDATDPSATITGLSGGSFSSTSGLSINTSTGAIDVSASTPGLYTVTYTTAGTCPNSSNVNVTVNALDDASFNYSTSAYCADATDPSATITGLSGGSFSSTSGLSINTSTGAIDVSASTPGLYTVTYTTAGTCPNSSNVNVTVNALDDASFNYSASAYCADATDPSATITGLSGGSFSSTSGLSINTSTGAIDVSASTPGLYIVTYTTAGTCPNSSNVNVTVNALDDASFNYSTSAYCADATDPSATITGLSGGSFSSTSGLSINTSTGAIDVSASTPGLYTVTYTTAGTCPNSSNVNVTVNALDDASFSYSAATYDTGDPDATPTITGLAGGAFSSSPVGLSINSVTGVIDTSASTVDTYLVTYTTAGSCPNTSNVNITITSSLSNEAVENRLELSILNPVKEVLTIIGTERITSVSVYSLTGALVATSKDISHLETGLYIAVLETSKGTISKKIIKK